MRPLPAMVVGIWCSDLSSVLRFLSLYGRKHFGLQPGISRIQQRVQCAHYSSTCRSSDSSTFEWGRGSSDTCPVKSIETVDSNNNCSTNVRGNLVLLHPEGSRLSRTTLEQSLQCLSKHSPDIGWEHLVSFDQQSCTLLL